MQPDRYAAENTQPTPDGYALLRYEIQRTKGYLKTHGESPVILERLKRLEALLETCLNNP